MVNILLKFPHRALRFVSFAFLFLLVAAVIADASGSFILNRYLSLAQRPLQQKENVRFEYGGAFFDIFSGAHIFSLRFGQDNKELFSAKRVNLQFDLLKLFSQKRLFCKQLYLRQPYLHKADFIDKKLVAAILSGIQLQKDMIRSTVVRIDDFNVMEIAVFDVDGYVAFAQSELLVSRGKLKVSEAKFLASNVAASKAPIDDDINYAFEATFRENDFLINKLELTGYGAAHLLFTGRINDFTDAADFELQGEISSVLLDELQVLNNRNFSVNGFADCSLRFYGPIEKPLSSIKVKFTNCSLSFFDSFYIKKIESDFRWDDKDISLELAGFINEAPLTLTLKVDKRTIPQISAQAVIKDAGAFHNGTINFQGYRLNKIIGGDLEAAVDYTQKKKKKKVSVEFSNMYFNLETLNFQSNALNLAWFNDASVGAGQSLKAVSLTGLSADVETKKNSISLDDFKAAVYGGTIQGNADVVFDVNDFSYDAKFYLQNLEITDFAREFLSLGYQLSGVLSGTMAFSSDPKKRLSGEVQVANGKVYDNAVLTAVADFFSLPSLRTIDFSKLRINFLRSFDKYHAGINLSSDPITIYWDNQFLEGGVMDGYLSVRISSRLMDESKPFRRLFKYIEYKEPTVYFPFNLRGYVENPRIEWLQNEFKDKLENFLKDKHKKILQDQLNKLAKDFMK